MKRLCMRVACPSCCRVVAVLFQKRVLGFLSGNLGQPRADRPELAAVQTPGGIYAILGAGSPTACGCHSVDRRGSERGHFRSVEAQQTQPELSTGLPGGPHQERPIQRGHQPRQSP